jgi:hypothetical protein
MDSQTVLPVYKGNPMKPWHLVALVVFAAVFALVIFGRLPAASPDESAACAMSQTFVRQNLKAPSTATFPAWSDDTCTVTRRNHIWVVRSYVDAQNSFGAMLRTPYTVEMTYSSSRDTWTLTDIAIAAR